MTRFDPQPGEQIRLDAPGYEVMPHPQISSMAFGQEGRKAIVYQLRNNGSMFALKIFKPKFRDATLVDICNALSQLSLPGLEVCDRDCFTPGTHSALVSRYPEMEYAVLMPWIEGSTWFDIVFAGMRLNEGACKQIAKSTADVLAELEDRGFAHCDVAGSNVIVNTMTGMVNFIDVEDMYGPSLPPPSGYPQGTEGYQHCSCATTTHGQWCAEGDRFAAAVLLSEMLVWHSPQIRQASDEEHYFANEELQDPHCDRYELMVETLGGMSEQIAGCFERAWHSTTLEECPPLSEWAKLLEFPLVSEWMPIEAPPPPPPYQPDWVPIRVEKVGSEYTAILVGDPGPPAFPPGTPKFFRIQRKSDSAPYELHWLAVSSAEGYIVERAADEAFTNAEEVYKGPDDSWTDPEQPGEIRYYRVCAYNGAGRSQWSYTVKTWD